MTVAVPSLPAQVVFVLEVVAITSVMVTAFDTVIVSDIQSFVAMSVTSYVPATEYVTEGEAAVLVAGVPPENIHSKEVASIDVLVKVMACPKQAVLLDCVNEAVGSMPMIGRIR